MLEVVLNHLNFVILKLNVGVLLQPLLQFDSRNLAVAVFIHLSEKDVNIYIVFATFGGKRLDYVFDSQAEFTWLWLFDLLAECSQKVLFAHISFVASIEIFEYVHYLRVRHFFIQRPNHLLEVPEHKLLLGRVFLTFVIKVKFRIYLRIYNHSLHFPYDLLCVNGCEHLDELSVVD